MVLCLPVVHGGMVRNSSKVRTRGLQHFQPVWNAISLCTHGMKAGHDMEENKARSPFCPS